MNDTKGLYISFVCEFDQFSCKEFKDMIRHYDLYHKSQRNGYSVMGKLSDREVRRVKREVKELDELSKVDKGV